MLYSAFLRMPLYMILKVPTKGWLQNGILTNTKNIGNQLKWSFKRLLKPMKFSLTETKELTMMNFWTNIITFRMQIQHSRDSLMSMVLRVMINKSSSINTILIHWITTTKLSESRKMLALMISKKLTENWPFNIIQRTILITKRLIKNSFKSTKPTTLSAMNLEERIMIIWSSDLCSPWELTAFLMISLDVNGFRLRMI